MNESVHIGRVAGIRIGANWSLIPIFVLIVWGLAAGQLPHAAPGYSAAAYFGTAAWAGVLFFASLLAHELAHALEARRRNIAVDGIVLWVLGGVSKLRGEPADPRDELRIAIVGPATSLALALGFFGLSRLAGADQSASLVAGAFGWLGWVNAALGVFNLVPALPLDGGRVLRSLLWRHWGRKQRATVIAAGAGRVFGFGFMALGVAGFLAGIAGLSGLWLAVVGWFIVSASNAEVGASPVGMSPTGAELTGLRARDAMTPDPLTVPAWAALDRLVEEGVRKRRLSSFPVVDNQGCFVGLVTLERIRRVPVDRWNEIATWSVACPAAQCVTCGPDDDLPAVAGTMYASPDRRAVVLVDGRVVGILAPSDLRRVAAHQASRSAPTAS
jgi:Zn-dependent protease/CBS domain-containing protein